MCERHTCAAVIDTRREATAKLPSEDVVELRGFRRRALRRRVLAPGREVHAHLLRREHDAVLPPTAAGLEQHACRVRPGRVLPTAVAA